MAVAVKTLLAATLLLAAATPAPAPAMGPAAPFTPPAAVNPVSAATATATAAAAAASASSSSSAATASGATSAAPAVGSGSEGLSGLRLAGAGSAALIDGRWWPLGSQPRGARLVAVQRQQVQLRHANGQLEWLPLNPAASLTTSATFGATPSLPQPRTQTDTATP